MIKTAPELIAAWTEMWNSYDLDQVERLFLPDDRLTYLSSERQGVIRGYEAIVAHHQGFGFVAGGKASENRLWLSGLVYAGFDQATVVAGTWHFQRGSGPEQRGPVTFVCGRQSGAYRFWHLNFGNYPA